MPSPSDQNAYEILGVPRTATQDEVKKRYRELARQLHPDVNQNNPSAARQFSQVTQAYKTLSDPDSRKAFDAELTLREQRARQAAPPRPATSAPGNAAGQSRPQPAPASSGPTESVRLTGEARAAFLRDRPVEARALAQKAISLNRRNADAWEVLGDVFRRQGRSEDAVNAYSMSLQINPRNTGVMQRLERMAKAAGPAAGVAPPRRPNIDNAPRSSYSGGSARANYGAPNASGYTSAAPGRVTRLNDPDKRPIGILLTALVGYGSVFMLVLFAALFHGDAPLNAPPILTWVSSWNVTIATVLGLSGFILGATMTISGAIRRIDDELILNGVTGGGGSFMPTGLILIVVSVLNFYIAAALYGIINALQESFTPSMLRVFAAVVGVTTLLSAVYMPGHLQVFLFGGNVVFITFVIGWLLGDFFRPAFE